MKSTPIVSPTAGSIAASEKRAPAGISRRSFVALAASAALAPAAVPRVARAAS